MPNENQKKVIDQLVAGLRGPVPADLEIAETPEIAAALQVRSERISKAVDAGLRAAEKAGAPAVVGFRLALQSAMAAEIEHAKREILAELAIREERLFEAASLASRVEHGEA